MRTANPALNDKTFGRAMSAEYSGKSMTLEGTVNKTGILLMLIIAGAAFTWQKYMAGSETVMIWMIGGLIGGLIMAVVTSFNPKGAMYTAPIYALLEGLFLGGFSAFAQDQV
ncbi:MAG: Bax inhibitor-1/YccA family protein, partial [Candidatus Hydrogenedentes bacterium]|nr:Bax inhibitor-1/YccA family protein [Candidatus Hydrogenedentota bacterium]